MITKILNVIKQEMAEMDSRILSFLGTSSAEDRDADIITADGWEIDNYSKNPVFLWGHDYSQPPIGRAVNLKQTDNGLVFDIEFAKAETYPFADTIYKLYRDGFLSAVSVGFIPKEMSQDPNTRKRTIKKKELLELSAVSVPANPEALRLAYSKGLYTKDEISAVGVIVKAEPIKIEIMSIDAFVPESMVESVVDAGAGISAMKGKLKTSEPESENMEIQAYLFDAEKWTMETAQKWVDETLEIEDIETDTAKEIKEHSLQLYKSLLSDHPVGCACHKHNNASEIEEIANQIKNLI